MLTSLASFANRHKAGPGNIMQPPGTKVRQVGTKRAQGILCNPLVPKLARLVPNGPREYYTTPWYQKTAAAFFGPTTWRAV